MLTNKKYIFKYHPNSCKWYEQHYDQNGNYHNITNPANIWFNKKGKIIGKLYKLSILRYPVRKLQWMNIIKKYD